MILALARCSLRYALAADSQRRFVTSVVPRLPELNPAAHQKPSPDPANASGLDLLKAAANAIYPDEDEDATRNFDESPSNQREIRKKPRDYVNLANIWYYTPKMLSKNYREPRSSYQWPLQKLPGPSPKDAQMTDIFHLYGMDPLKEVTNAKLLCSFLTGLGKIRARHATGLSQRNQRRLGRAIRRARAMGIIPFMSKNRASNDR